MAPDKNIDRIKEAEETTKILNQAFYILSDPERRKQYDRVLRYTRGKDFGKILNAKECSVEALILLEPYISKFHRSFFNCFAANRV